MHMVKRKITGGTAMAVALCLFTGVTLAQGSDAQALLPPPGPYLSSRPLLEPVPQGEPAAAPQGARPSAPAMPPAAAGRGQPYGYPGYVPPQGYSPYGSAPYGYPRQPRGAWQAPAYPPQQGGWRW
jgi:hypothetical protein